MDSLLRSPRTFTRWIALTLTLTACAGDDSSSDGTEGTTSAGTTTVASAGTTSEGTATVTGDPETSAGSGATATTTSTTTTTNASDPSGDPGGSSESSCENFLPPIEPSVIDAGQVGVAYEVAFMVPGLDLANTAWTVEGGSIPDGLEFDVMTGILAGTPTTAGRSMFALIAAPLNDNPDCPTLPTSTNYTLVIDP